MNQTPAKKLDVENVPPVVLLFGHQKIEQQSCNPSIVEGFRDPDIPWAQSAGAAAMRENDQCSGSIRTSQRAGQAKRRDRHFPRNDGGAALVPTDTAKREIISLFHDRLLHWPGIITS
jgi:hypothetical protein